MTAPNFTKKLTSSNTDVNIYDRNDIKQIQDIIDATHTTQRIQATSIETVMARLGVTTLTTPGDSISVAVPSGYRHLEVYCILLASGQLFPGIRFNGDSGANYTRRFAANGGADTSSASQTQITQRSAGVTEHHMMKFSIINLQAIEKWVNGHCDSLGAVGPTNACTKLEFQGKWANTATVITSVDIVNLGTGDFDTDSGVVLMGMP